MILLSLLVRHSSIHAQMDGDCQRRMSLVRSLQLLLRGTQLTVEERLIPTGSLPPAVATAAMAA